MTPPVDEATGELFGGRYERRELLGRGAMADVYRALDVMLGREVALKVMRVPADGSPPAPRARVEMALLASLNHPALVTLYDGSVEHGQTPYLVMELVDGPTLAAELARGPLHPAEVARIAADLADGLDTVHAAGVVHRDIKPSNILLTGHAGRRRAKLADFGIAHLIESERLTSPGLVIGTAAYLAPEQVRGAVPAPPADIYALGLVLREALVGERAFPHATGIGAATARLVGPPEIPARLGPEWHALLTAMTAADPAERPTARAVADAVAALPAFSAPPATVPAAQRTMPAAQRTMPAGQGAVPAAQGAMPTMPLTGPTAVMTQAAAPAADPPAAPSSTRDRRPRRGMLLLAAGIALVAAIGAGAAAWWPEQVAPSTTRSSTPTAPATPEVAPTTTGETDTATTTTGGTAGTSRDAREERKAAEDAAREAQKAADKAAKDDEKKSGDKGRSGKD